MKQQTSPIVTGVPPAFLNRFGSSMTGVLSGFDRLPLRGALRHLFQPTVMEAYLARIQAAAYATAELSPRA
jgi:hypothetical protein